MPYTRTVCGLTMTRLDTIEDFIPEETYATLSEALNGYGIILSETVSVTDDSWHSLSNAPTGKGACLLRCDCTDASTVFVCTKNGSTSNVSKISSVTSGSIYLDCRWSNTNIEIRAVTNSASFDITVIIG